MSPIPAAIQARADALSAAELTAIADRPAYLNDHLPSCLMRWAVALIISDRCIVLCVGGAAALVTDCGDIRGARRLARAVLRALGLPGRDVRRLCGGIHGPGHPAVDPPRRPCPPRAVLPVLEWVDVIGCPVLAPTRLPTRRECRDLAREDHGGPW